MNWNGFESGRCANIFTRLVTRLVTQLVTHLGRDEGADFVEPAGGEHFVDAGVDAGVEGGARRREADFGDGVAFERVCTQCPGRFAAFRRRRAPSSSRPLHALLRATSPSHASRDFGAAGAENFGDGFSGEDAHLDGADYFLRVARGDAGGGGGVEASEDFVEMHGTSLLGAATEALAEFFGARGRVGEAFEEGAEVEARTGGEDGEFRAAAEIVEREKGVAAVVAGGEDFVGLDEVDEMMRDVLLVARRRPSRCRCRSGDRPALNRRRGFRR